MAKYQNPIEIFIRREEPMDAEEIFQATREVCAEILGVAGDAVTPSASLRDDLGADSLDFAELAMALEDRTGVRIPDGGFAEVKTIQDVVEIVRGHQSPVTS
jgi:acyl carrier protein